MTENELRSVLSTPWLAFYPNPADATLSDADNMQCAGFYRVNVVAVILSASPYWTLRGKKRTLTVQGPKRILTIVGPRAN